MKTCECCGKKLARYIVSYDDVWECPHCRSDLVYLSTMRLCSTQCPNMYWTPIKYLTPKDSRIIEYVIGFEDECIHCYLPVFGDLEVVGLNFNIHMVYEYI